MKYLNEIRFERHNKAMSSPLTADLIQIKNSRRSRKWKEQNTVVTEDKSDKSTRRRRYFIPQRCNKLIFI